MGILHDAVEATLERWIRSRTPPQREVSLGQRQIFIIPNRYGLGMLVLVVVLFVMGTNYQNNLVLALAFWLIALFVLSIHLTYLNLSGLTLHVGHSDSAFVGEPMQHTVHLHTRRPRYGLLVSGDEQPERMLDELPAGTQCPLQLRRTALIRGLQAAPRMRLETRFPFGWITAWTYWSPDQSGLAWPAPVDHGLDRISADAEPLRPRTPQRTDPDALDDVRDYAAGDPLRRVLWRHYARRGVLVVKAPPRRSGDTRQLDIRQVAELPLERGLEQLTYWLLASENAAEDWSLRLHDSWLPPGQGATQKVQGLDALALTGPPGSVRDQEGRP
ncbi:MAG: DUF58 domain-containing protein [Natronospirillum sp.]|uniref:DUF58 domain-containing protein n=1 Tax=Natronospirillum sp. TaxID=2812955 RepID=UPI0025E0C0C6|nr:DUF58 domain-containing protein [Natronospirillum sp.]MCH8551359.1 DUF58 domain-containing protein [Natronospirillum sp.]